MIQISVVIPTYKPGAYIWECLDSLSRQTFPKEDYEVIIVLNGEKEPYFSQIADYARKHEDRVNIQLLYSEKAGVSSARNMGIDLAKGQYLCFIDDDDWVSESYLEGLLSSAKGDDSMVISNVINYDEKTNSMKNDWLTASYQRNSKTPNKVSLLSCRSFMSVACCKLTARKAIGEYRFDTRFKQGEDSLFNAVMSHRLKHFGVAPPDTIYYRRLRQNSAARSRSLISVIRDNTMLALEFIKNYLKNITKYNAYFFITRVLACIKATLREIRKK